ncbi:unnamed protein product [Chironomus riparius]|uniref:NACHT domain-containing protein n=1 Tax=Chironomus riparius TaxID=315576 RepID=A0A9N9S7J3_9DIPT|nr:unnamed protein product [Chironomus riparius]
MSKFIQNSFLKLQNLGKLASQGGAKDTNETYYELTSDHISQILDGQVLDFSDSHFQYLNNLVNHDWKNLAGKLKQKFLTSNFTFQNESLKFEKLAEISSEVFNSLSSEQIVDVLDGKELVIGSMIQNRTEFYVERRFIFRGSENVKPDFTFFRNVAHSMDDIIYLATRLRVFILSSDAGSGKTVAFEQFTMRIKREYPTRWVSYVDLKFYDLNFDENDTEKLLHKILNLNLKNDFELKIFDELYKSGNVVLLWNGFDKIPLTKVFDKIYKTTQNIQFVSCRPSHFGELEKLFINRAYQLIPFNLIEQKEFLTKFFIAQNLMSSKIDEYVNIVQDMATTYNFSTPFMLKVIAYYELTSDHISQILDGQVLDFSDSHFQYLNNLVNHDWKNLAGKLKQKFLTSNFTFQNESLKFEKLAEISLEVFNSLSSEQIVDVLDGKELVIGSMIQNRTEFYVERRFIFEGIAINLANITYYINVADTMDDIIDKTLRTRVFILSSEAGAGKSVTFEQLAMRIKRKFPLRWVLYIDLKDYKSFYNTSLENVVFVDNIKELLHNILNLNSLNEFEKKIFDERLKSGHVVLLWNGFDEISPTYNSFISIVLKEIYTKTKIVQYVSTRPSYSVQLQGIFNNKAYQLIPLNSDEQKEFLRKYFIIQNIKSMKIDEYVEKIHNISLTYAFITPFMLKVIVSGGQSYLSRDTF